MRRAKRLAIKPNLRSIILIAFAVIFTLAGGCSDDLKRPIIYTITPDSQQQGGEIAIYGNGFGKQAPGSFVSIGGACAQVIEWSDGKIRVWVPIGIGVGAKVVVVVVDGTSSSAETIFITGQNHDGHNPVAGCIIFLDSDASTSGDLFDVTDADIRRPCVPGSKRRCGTAVGTCEYGEQICGDDGAWGDCQTTSIVQDEICDGKDNNCDGQVDEGCECKDGDSQACVAGNGECAFGRQGCVGGKWGPCQGPKPTAEICDGKDNDCDGVVDNSVKNVCGSCGLVPKEICDGVDNDCDGQVDEDCGCKDGETQECGSTVGACKAGRKVCANGVFGPCVGAVVPQLEICDGSDNDCDGDTDEDCSCTFPSKDRCGTDLGECEYGTRECSTEGKWGSCVGGVSAGAEICGDGKDNDCDGQIDEGCKCNATDVRKCGSDRGECQFGQQVCSATGEWGPCVGEIQPANEECDGRDNDCDGTVDNGCECKDGEKRQCGSDVGLCKKGVQVCVNGAFGPCLDGVKPANEVCDNQDNDCDGQIDENLRNACGDCGPLPGEICDGQDNNCSGQIDEGCTCKPGNVQPCGSGVGECATGKQVCLQNGQWSKCDGETAPKTEVCDRRDNDCDGQIDEGVKNACGTCGPVPQEVCDGQDNDCDGQIDEGCRCRPNTARDCGSNVGECRRGRQSCGANGTWGPCLGGTLPQPETCDNKDNNCNGRVDEGVTNACGTCGPVPKEECDGLDNDCDTLVDEGCKCKPNQAQECGSNVGECSAGKQLCLAGGVWGPCNGATLPSTEQCNDGKDNDCDGSIDENCACKPDERRRCGDTDIGLCRRGVQRCLVDGSWSPCVGEIGPQPEICDGRDNDCDGRIDNNCNCQSGEKRICGTSVGECLQGTMICGDNGKFGACIGAIQPQKEICDGKDNDCDGQIDEGVTNLCGTCGPAPKEECDGVDNDCDGVIDEGCDCKAGESRLCRTNVGACEFGKQGCIDGKWSDCNGGVAPKSEVCDRIDNDCDGLTDEGLVNACGKCGPTPAELCDGKDNNCDGVVDEGCRCRRGQVRLCGSNVGLCLRGQQICSLDGTWSDCLGGITPRPEVCDGGDNDCDGSIDEGVKNLCGECGPTPAETCDGKDNDCDHVIDEGCECKPGGKRKCGTNVGICGMGTQFCQGDGTWSACLGGTPPVSEVCDGKDNDCDGSVDEGVKNACGTCGPTPAEICDGKDNNCDGRVDEGCQCITGQTRGCGPQNIGECRRGTQRCNNLGRWGSCVGAVRPTQEVCDGKDNDCDGDSDEGLQKNVCGTCGPAPTEVCDGKDNDCDGAIDEGCKCNFNFPPQTRTCGTNQGACTEGTQVCGFGGEWGPCILSQSPTPEICDGIDNNCDGQIDEGCDCDPGKRRTCGSDVGLCQSGIQTCSRGGKWGACEGEVTPQKEICGDSIDNDCDGAINDGCPCSGLNIRPCGTSKGACTTGIQACLFGQWRECQFSQGPTPERCGDKIDNDCDGQTDELLCI